MQLTAKSEGSSAAAPDTATTAKSNPSVQTAQGNPADPADSGYVGKHRPHRMSLLRQRVRASKLTVREGGAVAKVAQDK